LVGGGGAPISYDRRRGRQQNVGGGGAAAHSSTLNCINKAGTQRVKNLDIRFFRFPRDKECEAYSGQQLFGVWPSCPSITPGYASCILFQVFHKISFLSCLRYFWLCPMSLFFIQQYIVAQTSQFLTEIQNTVNSSPLP